ncbi:MAG: ATP-dependent DNA helicase [Clostridia bacterium]|nr:ATP-dependent DNA helicase [Clostridia bacterium]
MKDAQKEQPENEKEKYKIKPNKQQQDAIKRTDGPLLIIAGPGTGKTYTLIERVAYLVREKKVNLEKILLVTFTNKAAKELLKRLIVTFNGEKPINLNDMYIGTFHSVCTRILDEHIDSTRLKKNYKILDKFDQQYLIFQNIDKFKEYYEIIADKKNSSDWEISDKISKYVNMLRESPVNIAKMEIDAKNDKVINAWVNMINVYKDIMEDKNVIDFSGILKETYDLINKNCFIKNEMQSKFEYIMVDEYQDTNKIQEELIFLLAGEKMNICVVGDDDQALYRFRGATTHNIFNFENKVKKECKIELNENYRSEEAIVNFYNKWMIKTKGFSWNGVRVEKKPMEAVKYNCRKEDDTVLICSSEGEEKKEEWHENIKKFIDKVKNKGEDLNKIAFLCKSVRATKVIELIEYLEKNGIKVYSPRSNMFFEREEVKQAIGCMLLCFIMYYKDTKDTIEYKDRNYKISYYDYKHICLEKAKELISLDKDLCNWIIEKYKAHEGNKNADFTLTELLYQLLNFEPFRGYIREAQSSDKLIDTREARSLSILSCLISKYDNLPSIASSEDSNCGNFINKFFNEYLWFLYDDGISEYEDDVEYAPKGCISFMTIHQSKGMQFPIVLVDSLQDKPRDNLNEFPEVIEKYKNDHEGNNTESKEDIFKYYDFWRLYYTAFSRAQNILVLTDDNPNAYFKKYFNKDSIKNSNIYKNCNEVDLEGFKFEEVKPNEIIKEYSYDSQIEVYDNCPMKYKYLQELGFPSSIKAVNSIGKLVHMTIDDINKIAAKKSPITDTKKLLEDNFKTLSESENFILETAQINEALNQISMYEENYRKNWSTKPDTKLDAKVDISKVEKDYILKATIDLLREHNNNLEIIEFFSGKKPDKASKEYISYERKLVLCEYLVKDKYKDKYKNIELKLYCTGDDSGNPYILFDKIVSKEKIINHIYEVVKNIQEKKFETKAKDHKSCDNCGFRYYCKTTENLCSSRHIQNNIIYPSKLIGEDNRALLPTNFIKLLPNDALHPFIELVKNHKELELCFRSNDNSKKIEDFIKNKGNESIVKKSKVKEPEVKDAINQEKIIIYRNSHIFLQVEMSGEITINFGHAKYCKEWEEHKKNLIEIYKFKIPEEKKDSYVSRSSENSCLSTKEVEELYSGTLKPIFDRYFEVEGQKDIFDYFRKELTNPKKHVEQIRQQELLSAIKEIKNGYFFYDKEFAIKHEDKAEQKEDDANNKTDMLAIKFDIEGKPDKIVFAEVKSTKSTLTGKTGLDAHIRRMRSYKDNKENMQSRRKEAYLILTHYAMLGLRGLDETIVFDYDDFSKLDMEILIILTDEAKEYKGKCMIELKKEATKYNRPSYPDADIYIVNNDAYQALNPVNEHVD